MIIVMGSLQSHKETHRVGIPNPEEPVSCDGEFWSPRPY